MKANKTTTTTTATTTTTTPPPLPTTTNRYHEHFLLPYPGVFCLASYFILNIFSTTTTPTTTKAPGVRYENTNIHT